MSAPLLRITDLTVTFGAVTAVNEVSLDVREGELLGLIGPNGAGKTTVIDALTGFVQYRGRVELDGAPLDGLPAHRRARRGLTRTFQSLQLFEDLTIAENLQVGGRDLSLHPGGWLRRASGHDQATVAAALDAVGLPDVGSTRPGSLSHGQRKLVSVARGLAARPRLMLLDEPAAGLDSSESAELGRHLRAIVRSGITTLLVDHDMGLVLGICDRIVVLERGRVLADGTPSQIRSHPAVVAAYLGAQARVKEVSHGAADTAPLVALADDTSSAPPAAPTARAQGGA